MNSLAVTFAPKKACLYLLLYLSYTSNDINRLAASCDNFFALQLRGSRRRGVAPRKPTKLDLYLYARFSPPAPPPCVLHSSVVRVARHSLFMASSETPLAPSDATNLPREPMVDAPNAPDAPISPPPAEVRRRARRASIVAALSAIDQAGLDTSIHATAADGASGSNADDSAAPNSASAAASDDAATAPTGGAPSTAPAPACKRGRTREELWMDAVERCVLLAGLPAAELQHVISAARPYQTETGAFCFRQGDALTGGFMYVVASGRYRATMQRRHEGGGGLIGNPWTVRGRHAAEAHTGPTGFALSPVASPSARAVVSQCGRACAACGWRALRVVGGAGARIWAMRLVWRFRPPVFG